MLRRRETAGFTLIEMLLVVALLVILGTLAVGYYQGIRVKRMRAEVVNSLPGLRAFETYWWDRTGGYIFSRPAQLDTDRILWNNPTPTRCDENDRVRITTFQIQVGDANVGWTPQGCQWEYFVISDRCANDCSDAGDGDACDGVGNCFCAIAEVRDGAPLVPPGERFCMDDLGRQFSTSGIRGW